VFVALGASSKTRKNTESTLRPTWLELKEVTNTSSTSLIGDLALELQLKQSRFPSSSGGVCLSCSFLESCSRKAGVVKAVC
jgi:hypothetical protein